MLFFCVISGCQPEEASLRRLSERRLPRPGRGVSALSSSSRPDLVREPLACSPISPLESALTRTPRSADSKGLTAAKILRQVLYNLQLHDPLGTAENKRLITPVESALTKKSLATPLESALTKKVGGGVHLLTARHSSLTTSSCTQDSPQTLSSHALPHSFVHKGMWGGTPSPVTRRQSTRILHYPLLTTHYSLSPP
jgi:hypothetical protein